MDEKLIKQFFITKEKFLLFILINKTKLGIDENSFEEIEKTTDFKYVDDNINLYLGKSKTIKDNKQS